MDGNLMTTEDVMAIHEDCTSRPFEPRTFHRKDIDSLFMNFSDELSYTKIVNRLLNVFISDQTGRVVGVEIKGFSRALDNMKKFRVQKIVEQHPTLGFFLYIALQNCENGVSEGQLAGIELCLDYRIPEDVLQAAYEE